MIIVGNGISAIDPAPVLTQFTYRDLASYLSRRGLSIVIQIYHDLSIKIAGLGLKRPVQHLLYLTYR